MKSSPFTCIGKLFRCYFVSIWTLIVACSLNVVLLILIT
uniref:Uncharacterized protein n=1 Tax=Rhizophora mucronata TaxID=61149 RepID=A0A2P2NEN3_RHIMU